MFHLRDKKFKRKLILKKTLEISQGYPSALRVILLCSEYRNISFILEKLDMSKIHGPDIWRTFEDCRENIELFLEKLDSL